MIDEQLAPARATPISVVDDGDVFPAGVSRVRWAREDSNCCYDQRFLERDPNLLPKSG